MQEPGLTTEASRANPFYLLVALSNTSVAKGDVFIDDGESDPIGRYAMDTCNLTVIHNYPDCYLTVPPSITASYNF